MGLKKFLNQLLEPDSSFPESSSPPPSIPSRGIMPIGDELLVKTLSDVLRAVGEGCFDMDDDDADTIRARF